MDAFLKLSKANQNSTTKNSPSSSKTPRIRNVPWVEKYRPKCVADVVEQNEAVAVLAQCIEGADLPNLLFYGPPGTGKTSTILAAARQLFGDAYRDRILELNASDERGIQVVRDKVKTFAQISVGSNSASGKACPPFKIIILDEADSMTNAAQAALRRTMEKESKSTRFCLICNYVSRIIEPLTSRCTKFQFKPLGDTKIFERLRLICKEENLICNDEVLNTIINTSGGDMRRAITCLQSCSRLKGTDTDIELKDVYEVTGVVPDHWLNDYLNACKNDYSKFMSFVDDFLLEAYSTSQVLEQLNDIVINSSEYNNKQKAIIGETIGTVSYRLQDGGCEYIQLLDLGCSIMKALK